MNLQMLPTLGYDKTNVSSGATVPFKADFSKLQCSQAVWTSTTLSGSLLLRYSVDGINFQNFATATAISNTSGNAFWNMLGTQSTANNNIDMLYWLVTVTVTSGSFDSLKIYWGNISR
jgi:hypothetical protein